ncbi:MAG: hypothetical protein WCA22_19515 [Candidatus Binatus sp.]
MRLVKMIVPAALIAGLAVFAPHANAQTMGEYATTTAGVGTGGSSMGTSIGSTVGSDDLGGGSRTWGASSLGSTFEERAGAASSSAAGGNFDSRAGSMTGGAASQSRWPKSQFQSGQNSDRFADSSARFQDKDRFPTRTDLSSSDRFPPSQFNNNRQGLDTHYSSSGLDTHYSSSSGLDTNY